MLKEEWLLVGWGKMVFGVGEGVGSVARKGKYIVTCNEYRTSVLRVLSGMNIQDTHPHSFHARSRLFSNTVHGMIH